MDDGSDEVAGLRLQQAIGRLPAEGVFALCDAAGGGEDEKVEVFLRFLAQGVFEAEVADGVGVEEDAGHEGRGEDDADGDHEQETAMPHCALSDHAENGCQAAHGPSGCGAYRGSRGHERRRAARAG